jgi:hypothetical protein
LFPQSLRRRRLEILFRFGGDGTIGTRRGKLYCHLGFAMGKICEIAGPFRFGTIPIGLFRTDEGLARFVQVLRSKLYRRAHACTRVSLTGVVKLCRGRNARHAAGDEACAGEANEICYTVQGCVFSGENWLSCGNCSVCLHCSSAAIDPEQDSNNSNHQKHLNEPPQGVGSEKP